MKKTVIAVTGTELGWDCVVGVFDESVSREDLKKAFPEGQYVLHEKTIETTVEGWFD